MIHAKNLNFSIGDFRLRNVDIKVEKGKYFVLLGPAGSGKSIFLECLCGIRRVEKGSIFIDGRIVTNLEPRQRNIGYVPQDYALFKHLSVEDNITFALKVKGQSKSKRNEAAEGIAEVLGIKHLLKRRIAGLSGGEKQRVALGRALVAKPSVLLMDEPVCALDEARRQEICALLRKISDDLNLTVIHVSHNIEEAFSVADGAAIISEGQLQQTGTLNKLLREPANEYVARFMRCNNIFSCKALEPAPRGATKVEFCDGTLVVGSKVNGFAKLMVRPENVEVYNINEGGGGLGINAAEACVLEWRDFGSYVRLQLDGQSSLVAHVSYSTFKRLNLERSSNRVIVRLRPDSFYVFPEIHT